MHAGCQNYAIHSGPLQSPTNPTIIADVSDEFRVTWEAPFSLDLTNVDPDVVYCVHLINITCGVRTTLFDNCSILETELNFFGYSQHQSYELLITPRSNVEKAIDGTSLSIQG